MPLAIRKPLCLSLLICCFVFGLLLYPATLAFAAGRTVVVLPDGVSSMISTETQLQDAIDAAGSTPTRIVIGDGDTMITKTLVIPAGADIEIVNYKDAPWGGSDSSLTREDGFTGTMVRVEEGAKLTFNNNEQGKFSVKSRGQWVPSTGPTIMVKGSLTIDNGTIQGARGMSGSFEGAVTATGPKASITMNGGSITDNQRLSDPTRAQYGAGNVAVADGATFVMNGGSITEGRGSAVSGASYGEAGGLGVYNGGHAFINKGEITNNQGFGGGVVIWNWLDGAALKNMTVEQAQAKRSTVEMKGGLIANNTAGFGGGGVLLFGNASMTMSGGEMSGNTAPNGGAVNAMSLYTYATGGWAETGGEGPASGLSSEEYSKRQPAEFIMTGGLITKNKATRTGGGINVVSNAVHLQGGEISENTSSNMGGGVYVATKSYTLHVDNAAVYENDASQGGGVWTCPTGAIELYVTDGAAITSNKGAVYGDDIAHEYYGGTGEQPIYLEDRILGGGEVAYYPDDPAKRYKPANPGAPVDFKLGADDKLVGDTGLHAVAPSSAVTLAGKVSKLSIHKNTALRGGGIGTNGKVVFGRATTSNLVLEKKWHDETSGQDIDGTKVPFDEIRVGIFSDIAGGRTLIQTVVLKKSEGWKASLSNLPTTDPSGKKIGYEAIEIDENDEMVLGDTGKPLASASFDTSASSVVVSNLVTTLTVKKGWLIESQPAPEASITQPAVRAALYASVGGEKALVEEFEIRRDQGWSYQIDALPVYDKLGNKIVYSVSELDEAGVPIKEGLLDAPRHEVTIVNEIEPPIVPEEPRTPDSPKAQEQSPVETPVPQTGDNAPRIPVALLLLGGGLGLAGSILIAKRRLS